MLVKRFSWSTPESGSAHDLTLAWVPGTGGAPYGFGHGRTRRPIELGGFYISTTAVTQALWMRTMGENPAVHRDLRCPIENVSWEHVTGPNGFLDRLNASDVRTAVAADDAMLQFRLPSESEWEYAARGGPQWQEDLAFSGSNEPDDVAWYGPRWRRSDDLLVSTLGWRTGWRLSNRLRWFVRTRTQTHPVASKAPNQLGLYDMSGNVFEWCQDVCTDDMAAVPSDGRPYLGSGSERRLRGGSHQNWDLHCRVWWRYGIEPAAHDGCLGFRVVLARPWPAEA